ncbi:hypothetical protein FMM74_003530 [Lachnospiraceae bacterium MD308]|nr:hypothetical protein [Lachnospiraceae bacterium MD308]
MRIWAHRGCSQRYPENTVSAFTKASEIKGLTGIELDIQLSKDGHMVVIHDERIDRTTDGTGYVKDYTLAELKRFKIAAGHGKTERIPTIEEVLDILQGKLRDKKLKLNIELKNSIYPYEGMESRIVSLIHGRNLEKSVIYSSFYARSLEKIRLLDPEVELGILDTKCSDCLYKLKGGCGAAAIHPYWRAMDLPSEVLNGYTVRAWMTGHLYPEKPTGTRLDMELLEHQGITDIFLNEPEVYL